MIGCRILKPYTHITTICALLFLGHSPHPPHPPPPPPTQVVCGNCSPYTLPTDKSSSFLRSCNSCFLKELSEVTQAVSNSTPFSALASLWWLDNNILFIYKHYAICNYPPSTLEHKIDYYNYILLWNHNNLLVVLCLATRPSVTHLTVHWYTIKIKSTQLFQSLLP